MTTPTIAVVVDTGVFGAALARDETMLRLYEPHLAGRPLVISFQTVAELRYGAVKAGWRSTRRQALEDRLQAAAVVTGDSDLATTYAKLRDSCRQRSHNLAQKDHTADLWIATTAVHHDLPLVAHDRIFIGAPGLTLITELP